LKILLVEDDFETQNLMKISIQAQGYEVITADNGKIGLEMFKAEKPDLVITDIEMPEMNGLDLLKMIRIENKDVIVIVNTGAAATKYAIKALELKANNFLTKPVKNADLFKLLKKYKAVIVDRTIESEVEGMLTKKSFILEFGNEYEKITKIIDRIVLETGNILPKSERLGIYLGLSEIITNSIEHGNLGITYDETTEIIEKEGSTDSLIAARRLEPKYADRKVTVEFAMDKYYCQWLITDEGDGFDWEAIPTPKQEDVLFLEHGRGIFLSKMHFTQMEYLGKGNVVRLVKKLG